MELVRRALRGCRTAKQDTDHDPPRLTRNLAGSSHHRGRVRRVRAAR